MVMRLRAPYGVELWGWRLMLVGYALLALGAGTYYWGQWTSYNVLEDIGLWMDLPGALLARWAPPSSASRCCARGASRRLAAVLLLLSIPALFAISMVTSLGNTDLPVMFAVAMLASAETRRSAAAAGASTPRVSTTR